MPKTHYETVGTSPTATADQIRKAYLKRARQLHPDQFGDRPAAERARAERRMQDLNAAWAVLSDATKRRSYDLELGRSVNRGTGPLTSGRSEAWKPFDGSGGTRVPPRPKPGPAVADERDMEIRGTARLLRPGPLISMVAVVIALIVGATLLTGGGERDSVRPTPIAEPTGVPLACLDLAPFAETVPCGGHDAVVWSIVDAGEACPPDLEEFYRQGVGGLYCITRVG